MSTSELGYYWRMAPGVASSQQAASTGFMRGMIGNGLHIADMAGKVLVNAVGTGAFAKCGVTATGVYRRIISFGPFALSLKADGLPYPIRVRIAGAGDGKVGASVQFRIVATAPGMGATWVNTALDNVTESSTVGNTPAWLTTGSTLLEMKLPECVSPCMTQVPIIDSVGGDTNTATVCNASIEVWGTTLAGGSDVWLYGLHAQEYCGV